MAKILKLCPNRNKAAQEDNEKNCLNYIYILYTINAVCNPRLPPIYRFVTHSLINEVLMVKVDHNVQTRREMQKQL